MRDRRCWWDYQVNEGGCYGHTWIVCYRLDGYYSIGAGDLAPYFFIMGIKH